MPALIKLNLGAGAPPHPEGYVSVDRVAAFAPDVVCDLEQTPWPWESDSVSEIRAHHVLEHLGQTPPAFLNIMSEIHRILVPDGIIDIRVPHHRHDHQWGNYTHIRPITFQLLGNFDRSKSVMPEIYLETGVDLKMTESESFLSAPWVAAIQEGTVTKQQAILASKELWNVVVEERFILQKVRYG